MKFLRVNIFVLMLLLNQSTTVSATNFVFTGFADWTTEANWDSYPGTTILAGDTVFIEGACNIPSGLSVTNLGVLYIAFDHTIDNSGTIDSDGHLIVVGGLLNGGLVQSMTNLEASGSIFNQTLGTITCEVASAFEVTGLLDNQGIFTHASGVSKLNGNVINGGVISLSSGVERVATANGGFTNMGQLNINSTAMIEKLIQNLSGGMINIGAASVTVFSDDAGLVNEGEIVVNGIFRKGAGQFDATSVVTVEGIGLISVETSIPSTL